MEILRGKVVTPEGLIADGVLHVQDGILTYVGPWKDAPTQVSESNTPLREGVYLAPELVDIHNHGGGGVSFPDAPDLEEIATAVAMHRNQGTGRLLASLVTAPVQALLERVAILADAAEAGLISGIHVEGPFISTARCGVQNPDHIIPGDAALATKFVEAARGHLRTMTLAPETPHARDVIEALVAGGVVPSFGHTDAGADVVEEILEFTRELLRGSGKRPTITHLFNGMRPIHHRDPGPILSYLAAAKRGEVVVELIGDGIHLDPGIVRDVFELVGADNIALVTDAMAAAGMPDGEYRLGSLSVAVSAGVARLMDGDSIAGGTARLLDVVRRAVAGGVPLVDAIRSATLVPARIIDPLGKFGALRVGYEANILTLDENLRITDG